jgi:hypothetical protein
MAKTTTKPSIIPIQEWLRSMLPNGLVAMESRHNDCGEQTGDPEIDKNRDMPMCGNRTQMASQLAIFA